MPIQITMPRLSDTMEQGTLVKWYVSEGQEVEPDTVLADIETDKATMEMPTYEAGTVAKILVQEGESVNVGTAVMILAEEDESVEDAISSSGSGAGAAESSSASQKQGQAQSQAAGADESESEDQGAGESQSSTATAEPSSQQAPPSTPSPQPAPQPSSNGRGRITASPLARRLADEHGLDLNSIRGSGPSGKIIKRDVMRIIEGEEEPAQAPARESRGRQPQGQPAPSGPTESAAPPPPQEEGVVPLGSNVPLSNMRQTIAKRLVESHQSIPHYQVTTAINMDPLMNLRKTLNEQLESQGVKLSVNDFILRACALAMYRHPMFNASWKNDSIQVHERVNIGTAIALPEESGGGLVVATIFDADKKGLRQISQEVRALADKARNRGLTLEEMSNSTFTVSNLGMYDVEHFTAIINPPNSAILAVGAAQLKPVVRDGELTVGREMQATLSNDHRVVDGAMAARFLQTFKELLENPAGLLV